MTEMPNVPMQDVAPINDGARPTETQQKIMTALNDKGVALPCPRCGTDRNWWPADGFINLFLSNNPGDIRESTEHRIVAVASICGNCGYISFHDNRMLRIK